MTKVIIILMFVLNSCQKHSIYFDIKTQEVISCNNLAISSLSIDNDSIMPNGFPFEGSVFFTWQGELDLIPSNFSFDNIPKEYKCTKGGIIYKGKVKLKPNCTYTLQKSGNGLSPCVIKIWTNSKGIVYKTTHPICAKNEGIPKDWIKLKAP
jgi:hypothetical protein